MYKCSETDDKWIPTNKICDGISDCPHGDDEYDCHSCAGIMKGCDMSRLHCLVKLSRCEERSHSDLPNYQRCSNVREDLAPCGEYSSKCYPRQHVCIKDTNNIDGGLYCSMEEGLNINCTDFECPGLFKCRNDYCLHLQHVCDGEWNCKTGEDEKNCESHSFCSNGALWCDNKCISQELVCDGNRDCATGDDEALCSQRICPPGCTCFSDAISCLRLFLRSMPVIDDNVKAIFFSGNRLTLEPFKSRRFQYLYVLDLSYNRISSIEHNDFLQMGSLVALSLRGNDIQVIEQDTFVGLYLLRQLDLRDNLLTTLRECSFCGMDYIYTLDLSGQHLEALHEYAFQFSAVRHLNLSHNSIETLSENVFSFAFHLEFIDLRFNKLRDINPEAFKQITSPYTLHTDGYKVCCMATTAELCTPPGDVYSTCKDLMADASLRIGVWVLGLATIKFNIAVLVYRHKKEDSTPLSFLIQHLGLSDMLMGFYLLIIAGADAYYRGVYAVNDDHWRASVLCKMAGFLSMLSSEMSMMLLVFITADRVSVLGLGRGGLSGRESRFVTLVGWILCATLSILPIMDLSYFGNGELNSDGSPSAYIKHGVCFLFNFTDGKVPGWEFATFVFIFCNMLALTFVIVGYSYTIVSIVRRTGCGGGDELKVASKIACVIISDCFCWTPPLVMGIMSLLGLDINPEVAKWVAVFVFPINSALNPILYTFTGANCDENQEEAMDSVSSGTYTRGVASALGYEPKPPPHLARHSREDLPVANGDDIVSETDKVEYKTLDVANLEHEMSTNMSTPGLSQPSTSMGDYGDGESSRQTDVHIAISVSVVNVADTTADDQEIQRETAIVESTEDRGELNHMEDTPL